MQQDDLHDFTKLHDSVRINKVIEEKSREHDSKDENKVWENASNFLCICMKASFVFIFKSNF